MEKQWNISINDTNHTITYKSGFTHQVIVNNERQKLQSTNFFINLIDYPLGIEGAKCRLVVRGYSADLAINGIYHDSGKPYTPLWHTSKWVSVLMIVSIILGLILNGIMGIIIGSLLGTMYHGIASKGKPKHTIAAFLIGTIVQVILCFVVSFFW